MSEASTFRRLWQPPGRFEDRPRDRRVTFLELFFDLVFVVVISQLAHRLAGHVGWAGVGWFVFLFYYAPKKERVESKRLARIFGDDFEAYRKEVRSYFPRLTPWSGPKTTFGWEGVRINREYLITLAVAFGVAVLLLRYFLEGA